MDSLKTSESFLSYIKSNTDMWCEYKIHDDILIQNQTVIITIKPKELDDISKFGVVTYRNIVELDNIDILIEDFVKKLKNKHARVTTSVVALCKTNAWDSNKSIILKRDVVNSVMFSKGEIHTQPILISVKNTNGYYVSYNEMPRISVKENSENNTRETLVKWQQYDIGCYDGPKPDVIRINVAKGEIRAKAMKYNFDIINVDEEGFTNKQLGNAPDFTSINLDGPCTIKYNIFDDKEDKIECVYSVSGKAITERKWLDSKEVKQYRIKKLKLYMND